MNGFTILFSCCLAVSLMSLWYQIQEYESPMLAILFSVLFAYLLHASWLSDEEKAKQANDDNVRHVAEITPRKVSSADGCTVYTFKPHDRWLYFTKCEKAEVTTQNIYSVSSGKTSHTETMEIKTQ